MEDPSDCISNAEIPPEMCASWRTLKEEPILDMHMTEMKLPHRTMFLRDIVCPTSTWSITDSWKAEPTVIIPLTLRVEPIRL
jgi:hypothetical protein